MLFDAKAAEKEFEKVQDSGQRRTFPTGSVRDVRTGKGRFDLLDPVVLLRDARHMENGAAKYGDRNWEKGQPVSVYYDSAMRHLMAFWSGKGDEDHLAAARWNIGCIISTMDRIRRGMIDPAMMDHPAPSVVAATVSPKS